MSRLADYQIVTLLEDKGFVNEVIDEHIADDLADVFEDDPRIQRQLLTRTLEGDGSFKSVLLDPHASERVSTCQVAERRVGNDN